MSLSSSSPTLHAPCLSVSLNTVKAQFAEGYIEYVYTALTHQMASSHDDALFLTSDTRLFMLRYAVRPV